MKRKRTARPKRRATLVEFDLMAIRDVKRLAKRLVRKIAMMKGYLKKFRRSKASAEQIAAAIDAVKPGEAELASRENERPL
jgi:hypothetical protein